MTERDHQRLLGVHPRLIELLLEVYLDMENLGSPMFVVEGVRSDARQAELYALGRTKPGQIVTYKDGVRFRSNHQPHGDGLGYAIDSAFIPQGQRTDPFARTWPWERFGEALEARAIAWGGRWKMVDLPHAELLVQPMRPVDLVGGV